MPFEFVDENGNMQGIAKDYLDIISEETGLTFKPIKSDSWNEAVKKTKKRDTIHIYGRITALADVFDALGSDRVYKKAWPEKKIFNLVREERGEHFDPELVDLFFDNLDEFLEIRNKFKDE